MLVYVNGSLFEPEQGQDQIVQLVAGVGQRAKSHVDAERLAEGIRELKFKDARALRVDCWRKEDRNRPLWQAFGILRSAL